MNERPTAADLRRARNARYRARMKQNPDYAARVRERATAQLRKERAALQARTDISEAVAYLALLKPPVV